MLKALKIFKVLELLWTLVLIIPAIEGITKLILLGHKAIISIPTKGIEDIITLVVSIIIAILLLSLTQLIRKNAQIVVLPQDIRIEDSKKKKLFKHLGIECIYHLFLSFLWLRLLINSFPNNYSVLSKFFILPLILINLAMIFLVLIWPLLSRSEPITLIENP